MPKLDDLLDGIAKPPSEARYEPPAAPAPRKLKTPKPPRGWEPRVETKGDDALIVTHPTDRKLGHPENRGNGAGTMGERELIEAHGLDPDAWEIMPPIDTTRWQQAPGEEWLYRYRLRLRRRTSGMFTQEEWGVLLEQVHTWKPPSKRERPPAGEEFFVVNLADWQIGCGDGDGTPGTIRRVLAMGADVERRIGALRGMGRKLGTLVVAGMGDLGEGVCGFYDQQAYTVDLNQRQQTVGVVNLLLRLLKRWAVLFDATIVTAAGGNHGEQRTARGQRGGMTDDADNRDVLAFDLLQIAVAENPKLAERITFRIPEDELAVTIDLGGIAVAWTHGHLYSNPQKAWPWWKDLAFGDGTTNTYGLDQARVLNAGHFHHLVVKEPTAGRTFIQSPPMDGGSKFFADRFGGISAPGTVTYVVDQHGWDDLYLARAVRDYREETP